MNVTRSFEVVGDDEEGSVGLELDGTCQVLG